MVQSSCGKSVRLANDGGPDSEKTRSGVSEPSPVPKQKSAIERTSFALLCSSLKCGEVSRLLGVSKPKSKSGRGCVFVFTKDDLFMKNDSLSARERTLRVGDSGGRLCGTDEI